MSLNTKRLFLRALRHLNIDCVADVGSMNGAESLAFRGALPHADCHAFEANPANFEQMAADPALRAARIELVPMAVSEADGTAEFFVLDADYSTVNDQRGMSSLFNRTGETRRTKSFNVPATRLDTFFQRKLRPDSRVAFWIDVEGKAYQVIEGMKGIASQVHLIHAELETVPCINPQQKLQDDVLRLCGSLGLQPLAADGTSETPQRNWIFVRRDAPKVDLVWLWWTKMLAMARHLAGRIRGRFAM